MVFEKLDLNDFTNLDGKDDQELVWMGVKEQRNRCPIFILYHYNDLTVVK